MDSSRIGEGFKDAVLPTVERAVNRPCGSSPRALEVYKRTVVAHTPRVAPVLGKPVGSTVGSRVLYLALASPMLMLGLYVWPAADDFGYWSMAQSSGSPITFATVMYQNWSGRFAVHLLNGIVFSNPDLFPFFALLPPLAFISLPIGLIASLAAVGQSIEGASRWILVTLTLAALSIALLPYLSECVFWLTGGLVYVVPLLAGLVWLREVIALRPRHLKSAALVVLLTLPVSLANEQISGALIAATVVRALVRRSISAFQLLAVSVLVIGSVVLVLAPGNAIRATHAERGLSYSAASLVTNYASVIAVSWPRFIPAIGAGVSLGLVSVLLRGDRVVRRRVVAEWAVTMLAAAVGATLPFAAVPDFANARTAFVPGFFLVTACAAVVVVLLASSAANKRVWRMVGVGLGACLISAYAGVAMLGWGEARTLQPQFAARWALLAREAGSGKELVVPSLTGAPPLVMFAPDLATDPAYWANEIEAQFFGLKSVRTTEPTT